MTTFTGRWVLTLALLFSAAPAVRAQVDDDTKPFTPFRVNVVDGILNATLPFDVKFIIWGDVPENTTDVTLEIRKAGDELSCVPPPSGEVRTLKSKARKWTVRDYQMHDVMDATEELARKDLQFEVLVRELDPNSYYCMRFIVEPGRPMTLAEARRLRESLLPTYRTFLAGLGPLTRTIMRDQLEPLRQQLIEAIRKNADAQGMTITTVPNSPFDPDTTSPAVERAFLDAIAPILAAQNPVETRRSAFNSVTSVKTIDDWMNAVRAAARVPGLAATDRRLYETVTALPVNRAANMLLGLPIDQDVPDGTLKFEDVWRVNPMPKPPPSGIYDADTPCPAAGVLAERCLKLDEYRDLARDIGTRVAGSNDVLIELSDRKVDLLLMQLRANERDEAVRHHLAQLDALIRESYDVLVTTAGNASTRRPWYVSADSGIAVAPALGEVFPYIGTTMFFRPVNKAVPPTSFGTRFSVLFGLTWTDNVLKTGQREALFADDTTMLLGGGLRLTEWLRLTVGGLIFKAPDPNPLIDKTRLKMTPFVSMSADIDAGDVLKGLFGGNLKPPDSGRTLTPP